MIKSAFKQFLTELLPQEVEPSNDGEALNFAAAFLLFEVAKADYELDDSEWAAMKNALCKVLNIAPQIASSLLASAQQDSITNTSLYPFTKIINAEFSAAQKSQLMKAMWEVAFADGKLDKYEEHYLRNIADLLYIPHSQFIQQKLSVMP